MSTTCNHDHTSKHPTPEEMPKVARWNGRRYIVCSHRVGNDYCGALIDVTDLDVVKVNTCCGIESNHIGLSGIDALVV